MKIEKQKAKADWMDEAGSTIPFSMISKKEKAYEKIAFDVATAAQKAHEHLLKLKSFINQSVQKAIAVFHAEYKGKKTTFKGNYTITNFNQSIKIKVSVSNPIRFDDMTIQRAKDLLDEFLKEGISGKNSAIKEMVLSAFETRRGQMDVNKIMALKKYADRIQDHRYTKAMKLIDSAIRRPTTATYYNVEVKGEDGKYENIALSLADV